MESTLLEHPVVQEAAIIGFPDRIRNMIVKEFVVLNKGLELSESLVRDIRNYMQGIKSPVQIPA